MSLVVTDKLIQRQINHWNRFRDFLKDDDEQGSFETGPVITIIAGCPAAEAAPWPPAWPKDWASTFMTSPSSTRSPGTGSWPGPWSRSWTKAPSARPTCGSRGVLNQRIFLKDEYHPALVGIVTTAGGRGNVVFLGRGANLILGENATLRIRVVASRPTRLARIANAPG